MKNYPIRYIARFQVETASAMRVGTGDKSALVDNIVARDANGLPYIPGTSLAGIIRHALEDGTPHQQGDENKLFGWQKSSVSDKDKAKDKGLGSRIYFTDAYMLDHTGNTVLEGLQKVDYDNAYYSPALAVRDHVAISHKGVAKENNKYESELVRKGTRFVFEIELMGDAAEGEKEGLWNYILNMLHQTSFRIGAGTRNGFGELQVIECLWNAFNLEDKKEMEAYLQKSASLNSDFKDAKTVAVTTESKNDWVEKTLCLQAKDFFLFAAGDAESTPKTETYFDWSSGTPQLKTHYVVPATSIKGALSHRTAFHYNKATNTYIEQEVQALSEEQLDLMGLEFNMPKAVRKLFPVELEAIKGLTSSYDALKSLKKEIESQNLFDSPELAAYEEKIELQKEQKDSLHVGEYNQAVRSLFGAKKDKDEGARGNILFSDAYLKEGDKIEEKVFNHVKIDRFTGGGIDGALFTTTALHGAAIIELKILVKKTTWEADATIEAAFDAALNDLATGSLQLGGQTTKGHGAFKKTKKQTA